MKDLRSAYEFAANWIRWTFVGWPGGVRRGVYAWWNVKDYFQSAMRVCHSALIARMILRDDE